jgi:NADH dehydrogenase
VRTGALVTSVTPEAVHVGQEIIPTRTVVWAAGVAASPLGRSLGVPLDRSGRVLVEPDLSVPGHPEAYVVGDLAALHDPRTGQSLPGLGAVAIQQGPAAARTLRGQTRQPFRYRDKGSLAIIGRKAAVARFGKLHLTGRLALTLWELVHIFLLIGFQNRVLVMMQWIWSYLTYQRGVRLITRPWPFHALDATQIPQQKAPAAERAAMAAG